MGGSHGQLFLLGMGPGAQLKKEPHCFPGPESDWGVGTQEVQDFGSEAQRFMMLTV